LNEAKRLLKNNDKPETQQKPLQKEEYLIYGLLIAAGLGLIYYTRTKPVTKETTLTVKEPEKIVKPSNKPDPFQMK
jgi:hypothetical protein